MIYLFLVIWLLAIGKLCFPNYKKKYSRKTRKLFLILFFTACSVVVGFRCTHVGIDTMNYQTQFNYIASVPLANITGSFKFHGMEIGYVLFMKVSSILCNNYFFFQFMETIIFLWLFGRFILNNTEHVFLACVIFLGFGIPLNFMNVTRQMLAVAIAINGFCDLQKGRVLRSFCVLALSFTIQISAIVFSVSYILFFLRNKRKIIKVLPIVCLLFAIFSEFFVNVFIKFVPQYEQYIKMMTINQSAHFIILVWLIIVLVSILVLYKRKFEVPYGSLISVFCILFVLCNYLGFDYNYAERLGLFFVPFTLLLVPNFIAKIKSYRVREALNFCLSFGFLSLFIMSSLGSQQYKNYNFFWEH